MTKKRVPILRVGVEAESEFSANLSTQAELTFSGNSGTSFHLVLHNSIPLNLITSADSTVFSTSFDTVGVFSGFTENYWPTDMTVVGSFLSAPLINNYHHSQTPVRYLRMDDIVLSYDQNQLSTVTRESGDTRQLVYDSEGRLVSVTDSYTQTKKILTYNGEELSNVEFLKST